MDYEQFHRLTSEGEKQNVDYKIRCNAFASNNIAANAELVKDICAMAYNGNVASYIIIGVSDDASMYESVENSKLTEENLQHLCRTGIVPPPKVRLIKKRWKRGSGEQINKDFVIIQVGPQKRQVFRLNQDFINYREGVCFRRNEVWVRRGPTSDLATPDEIACLLKGQPYIEDEGVVERKVERDNFSRKSTIEQSQTITNALNMMLLAKEYQEIPKNDRPVVMNLGSYGYGTVTYITFWKIIGDDLLMIHPLNCNISLTQTDIRKYGQGFYWYYFDVAHLSKFLSRNKTVAFENVRRIFLLPSISSIPRTRIQRGLSRWNWSGNGNHFYRPQLGIDQYTKGIKVLPSSSEIVILDNVLSLSDLKDIVDEVITNVELNNGGIITPINNSTPRPKK